MISIMLHISNTYPKAQSNYSPCYDLDTSRFVMNWIEEGFGGSPVM